MLLKLLNSRRSGSHKITESTSQFYHLEKSRPYKSVVHDHIKFNKIERVFGDKLMTSPKDFDRKIIMRRQVREEMLGNMFTHDSMRQVQITHTLKNKFCLGPVFIQ